MSRHPNQITALDAAMALLFHVGRQWRGASEFHRWAATIPLSAMNHPLTTYRKMNPGTTITLLAPVLIYLSTSGCVLGQNWRQSFSASYLVSWGSVASSADGSKLLAVGNIGNGGVVYTSTDSGTTWLS